MEYDALILAGGRSSRLGGVPKAGLIYDGVPLVDRAIAAAGGAARTVVVGPGDSVRPDDEVLHAREDPPFSGPAAAIAAGLASLGRDRTPSRWTLVLACDMPHADRAVPVLLAACEAAAGRDTGGAGHAAERGGIVGGVVAESPDGRRQQLAAVYDTAMLQKAAARMATLGTLQNGSIRALLANLDVVTVPVPAGSTDDVDTWADAEALGVEREGPPNEAGPLNGSGQRLDEATLEADGEDAGPDS
ncbi:NTP transferase domain-containing protein [Pseudarthrobacter sp. J75]|uniref:molybdenum cofactor guanylyltransferase n=1 Tax=unclassified Pseudarthrobacter TaxID=2647000 RepID=UPI002E80DFB2|nr:MULTISPECIES: NTP transferase domain-containing protein [unclassified Pseudarthrobacter]MEE2523209.1 NTP transferase domain-containing protein [Pseudarthrobacter sp. J47]MEE2527464.1 NTP transferase domain-containing protein [Pseudarthrobacter sp. J75]